MRERRSSKKKDKRESEREREMAIIFEFINAYYMSIYLCYTRVVVL